MRWIVDMFGLRYLIPPRAGRPPVREWTFEMDQKLFAMYEAYGPNWKAFRLGSWSRGAMEARVEELCELSITESAHVSE